MKIQEKELEAEDEEDVADCIFNVPINLAQEFTKYDYNIGEPEGRSFTGSV
ncbi:hypothetical protein HORIV_47260 [Vreelandella olivaria]|uniref:Uncharacterized protein n=1 Tax=Vreelandella olivaria TaxID=390919 RepID=A0ABM7GMU4_9GAMM|nr:hypothetical protein HORIV_47260 [Halomonas olivaria]